MHSHKFKFNIFHQDHTILLEYTYGKDERYWFLQYLVCINLDKTFTAYRQKFTVCTLLTNLQQIPL